MAKPVRVSAKDGLERKRANKGLLHCLVLPKLRTATDRGESVCFLNYHHLRPAAPVCARRAAEIDHALALCIQSVGTHVERSHNRKHIARIRNVWLRNREIIRRTGKSERSTLGAGCDPEPLPGRSLHGDAAVQPIMAPPTHKKGMVLVVSAIGPCAKRLGQRGLAVTQARQRDLAVTALMDFLRVCSSSPQGLIDKPPQLHGMCDCSLFWYIY